MKPISLLVSSVLLLMFHQSPAQWVRTAGPEGGRAEQLLTTPTSVLLTTEGGAIYRTTDHGTTWVLSVDALGTVSDGCAGLVQTHGTIFAAEYGSGIFRSTNDGVSWTPSNGGLTLAGMFFSAIAASGDTLVIATYSGIHRSTDRGNQWVKTNTGMPPDTNFNALCSLGSKFLAGSDEGAGVFASSDAGLTWYRSAQGMSGEGLRVLGFTAGNGVVIAATRQGAYRSTDSGGHWVLCTSGLNNKTASTVYMAGGDIYGGTYGFGLYQSTNLGVDWVQTSSTPGNANIRAITLAGTDLIVGTYGSGVVYRSSNAGGAWTAVGHGITNAGIIAMATQPGRLIVGTYDGFLYSTNGGSSWSPADTSFPSIGVYSLLTKGTDVFVGSNGQGVFRSTDGGLKWFAARSGLGGNARTIWSLATDGSSLYAGTSSGVYRSTNDGSLWSQATQGIPDSTVRQVGAVNGATYAGVPSSVYRSTDNGSHWAAVNTGLPQYFQTQAFAGSDTDMYVGLVDGIYRITTKAGAWTNVSSGIPSSPDVRSLIVYPLAIPESKIVFAGLGHGGVYSSSNRGSSWVYAGTGIAPGILVTALTWGQGYLYAGTYAHGVWKRPISEVLVSAGKEQSTPEEFALWQNYPNPFNGSSEIGFRIADFGLVRLQLFDLLGREIATLVNEKRAAGTYSVRFDAGRLASGVYVYRLQAGRYVASRKMILTR